MRHTTIIALLLLSVHIVGQSDPIPGIYAGFYNGDNISLTINAPSANTYPGIMKDSYQTYAVSLTKSDGSLKGTATESSLGIVFQVSGTHAAEKLDLKFEIEVEGTKAMMDIAFSKNSAQTSPIGTGNLETHQGFPQNAEHPASLIGTWTKEELYQSGYGDNSMAAGFSQSMTFLPNGQIAAAGSNAHISGSNYSGQSSGGNNDVVPGVLWYTQANQLYLIVTENGVTQTSHLGKFYIEDQNMLITGTNGEKILMRKN